MLLRKNVSWVQLVFKLVSSVSRSLLQAGSQRPANVVAFQPVTVNQSCTPRIEVVPPLRCVLVSRTNRIDSPASNSGYNISCTVSGQSSAVFRASLHEELVLGDNRSCWTPLKNVTVADTGASECHMIQKWIKEIDSNAETDLNIIASNTFLVEK